MWQSKESSCLTEVDVRAVHPCGSPVPHLLPEGDVRPLAGGDPLPLGDASGLLLLPLTLTLSGIPLLPTTPTAPAAAACCSAALGVPVGVALLPKPLLLQLLGVLPSCLLLSCWGLALLLPPHLPRLLLSCASPRPCVTTGDASRPALLLLVGAVPAGLCLLLTLVLRSRLVPLPLPPPLLRLVLLRLVRQLTLTSSVSAVRCFASRSDRPSARCTKYLNSQIVQTRAQESLATRAAGACMHASKQVFSTNAAR
jgi:hypothetical protein